MPSRRRKGWPGRPPICPEYHATVEYKLYRISDPAAVATGSAKAHDIGSQGEVVKQALDARR